MMNACFPEQVLKFLVLPRKKAIFLIHLTEEEG